jgi:hypothetical protein
MKTWKKASVFITIALVTQLIVLIYINNHMLGSLNAFNPEEIKAEEEVKILIPDNIKELKSSYDGKYCSYYNESTLYIIDVDTGMRRKMEFKDGETLNLYKWYDNSNRMILAEQTNGNGAGRLKLTSYDAVLGKKEDIKDLSWLGNNIKINELNFAGADDVIVKITQADGRSDLYYIGTEVTKLSAVTRNIGFVRYTGKDSKVLYQDKTTKKYYITGEKKALELKSPNSEVIDFDSAGNVYIFEGDKEGKKYIYYKSLDSENSDWSLIELEEDMEFVNTYINNDGTVYIDNSLEGKFTEVKEKVSITYEGKLMAFFKGGIFTHKDDILEKVEFKDMTNK